VYSHGDKSQALDSPNVDRSRHLVSLDPEMFLVRYQIDRVSVGQAQESAELYLRGYNRGYNL